MNLIELLSTISKINIKLCPYLKLMLNILIYLMVVFQAKLYINKV